MSDRTCSIAECDRPVKTRGWCNSHYLRAMRHGSPTAGGEPRRRRDPNEVCSAEGCGLKSRTNKLCNKHYQRWWKYGDVTATAFDRRPNGMSVSEVVELNSERSNDAAACWLWTGPLNDEGYGTFSYEKRALRAHRVVYELQIGPIQDGAEIDHICRVRRCVNPSHLRLATRAENSQNKIHYANSRSGVRGVYELPNGNYMARVMLDGQDVLCKVFSTKAQATEAAVQVRRQMMPYSEMDKEAG